MITRPFSRVTNRPGWNNTTTIPHGIAFRIRLQRDASPLPREIRQLSDGISNGASGDRSPGMPDVTSMHRRTGLSPKLASEAERDRTGPRCAICGV